MCALTCADDVRIAGNTGDNIELHTLSNEDLLSKAQAQFTSTTEKLLSERRGVKRTEKVLSDAARNAQTLKIPAESVTIPTFESELEELQFAAEHAEQRLAALRERESLVLQIPEFIAAHLKQIDKLKSQIAEYRTAMQVLGDLVFECKLRIDDGSLEIGELPDFISNYNPNTWSEELDHLLSEVEIEAQQWQVNQQSLVATIQESASAVQTAQLIAANALRSAEQESRRQQLVAEYADRTPMELLKSLQEMEEERTWLKGAYNLAARRQQRAASEAAQIRNDSIKAKQELEAISVRTLANAQDIQAALGLYQKHSEQTAAQLEAIKALESALQAFESEVVVFNTHLSNMRVIVGVLTRMESRDQISPEQIPNEATLRELQDESQSLVTKLADTNTILTGLKAESTQLEQAAAKTELEQKYLEEQLARMVASRQKAQQQRRWESQIQGISTEELVSQFAQFREDYLAKQQTKKEQESSLAELQQRVDAERAALEDIQDPFYRDLVASEADERQAILRAMLEFAGLNERQAESERATTEGQQAPDTPVASPSLQVNQNVSDSTWMNSLVDFQKNISGRVLVIQEQDAQRKVLLEVGSQLLGRLESRLQDVSSALDLAFRIHAIASELKRRIGRGELDGNSVPDGIGEASNPEFFQELDREESQLKDQVNRVREELTNLNEQDKGRVEIQNLFVNIQSNVGTRTNIQEDVARLAKEQARARSELSDGELKTLEQRAKRRLQAEIPSSEWFDTSDEAKDLAELLETFYIDLLELEEQYALVEQQKEKTHELLNLSQDEEAEIIKLIPLLETREAQFVAQQNEVVLITKARLNPEKAAALLDEYRTRTGNSLEIPIAPEAEQRAELATTATNTAFALHLDAASVRKWHDGLAKRLLGPGIASEIAGYQEELNNLEAQASTIQRRIYQLSGHPAEEMELSPSGGPPSSSTEKMLFLRGEIGVTQEELGRVRGKNAWAIGYRIGGIVLGTVVLLFGIGVFLSWVDRRTNTESAQTKYLLSALRSLSRLAVCVVAIVMILSVLGFDIGAILAGLGIGGLAIGLAAQETIRSLISGIILFIEKPIKIGDVVEVEGFLARVEGMNWRTTHLTASFGRDIYIPNSKMVSANLNNWTKASKASVGGVWVSLFLSAAEDPNKVIDVCQNALEECKQIRLDDGYGTMVAGQRQMGHRMVMEYWPWYFVHDRSRPNNAHEEVWIKLHEHLTKAGISMDVQLSHDEG